MAGEPTTLRCAYLVSRYPAITHTFVMTEIRALRALGARIETVSIRRQAPEEILSAEDRSEFDSTHALLPATPRRLVASHLRAARRAPLRYLRTLASALRMSTGGVRAGLWQLFYFAEAALLWAWMEERGVAHIHVHFANPAADVAMLAIRLGNAVGPGRWSWTLSVHGPTELNDMLATKLAAKASEAQLVVCTSDYARSQVALAAPEAWDRLRTIRSGIELEVFAADGDRPVGANPVEVLNVASMAPRKGQSVLVEAIALARERGADVRLTLVGDGPERAALETQAAALGVADHVRFAGAVPRDEVVAQLHRTDLFALPSFAEGLPTVLLEAMAMGRPVVATNLAGIPELVSHGESGLLVAPARSDLLAAAIAQLARAPELRARFGAAGKEKVAREYDANRAAVELAAALEPIAARP